MTSQLTGADVLLYKAGYHWQQEQLTWAIVPELEPYADEIRAAMARWDDASDLDMVQVDPSQFDDADIKFIVSARTGYEGYTYILVDDADETRITDAVVELPTTLGAARIDYVVTHELGHALGLKHPTRLDFTPASQGPHAPADMVTAKNTVMGYFADRDGKLGEWDVQALNALLAQDGPLSPLLRPAAPALLTGAAAVRLHPVVQLLLTASQSSRPQAFAHAIEAMAMCGAMAKHSGGDERQVARAMTAGLLHDIGEMYMAPEYGEADVGETLDVECFRQLVVHPHVGRLLIGQLTDYPKDIVRAVGEHHERLDGTGYPYRLQGDQISTLGRLMAAAEAALASLRTPGTTLQHASVALRVIPGEFDDRLAGPLSEAARRGQPLLAKHSLEELRADLSRMNVGLQTSLNRLEASIPPMPSAGLQRAADISRHLLMRLRSGWNESGLWSPDAIGPEQVAEVEAIQETLRQRMRTIERAARLSAGELSDDEAEHLDHMCACLTDELN